MTLTPARTAPEGSETLPRILPPVLCAKTAAELNRQSATTKPQLDQRLIDDCTSTSKIGEFSSVWNELLPVGQTLL
jgi:hypothetical protein